MFGPTKIHRDGGSGAMPGKGETRMLKSTITREEHAALPEVIQAEYVSAPADRKLPDGTMILDVGETNGIGLANTGALMASLSTARAERDEAIKTLKPYRGTDGELLDATAARDALSKIAEIGDPSNLGDKAKFQEQLESAKQQLIDQYGAQIKEANDRRDGVLSALHKVKVEQAATAAIVAAGGGEHLPLILPSVVSNLRMDTDSDGFPVHVLGDDGNPRLSVKNNGANMGIDEYVTDVVKVDPAFAIAFNGSGASGGNRDGNQNKGRGGSTPDLSNMPPEQRLAAHREAHG